MTPYHAHIMRVVHLSPGLIVIARTGYGSTLQQNFQVYCILPKLMNTLVPVTCVIMQPYFTLSLPMYLCLDTGFFQ